MRATAVERSPHAWRWLLVGVLSFFCTATVFYYTTILHHPRALANVRLGLSPHDFGRAKVLAQYGNWSAYNELFDGLTVSECRKVFPDLYQEIDDTVKWYQDEGRSIVKEDTIFPHERPGIMHFLIHNNEFRYLQTQHVHLNSWRIHGFSTIIQRAMTSALVSGDQLPSIEATLNTHDNPIPSPDDTRSLWSVTRYVGNDTHRRVWLMPNFDFSWSQPTGSFEDAKRLAMQYDHLSFRDKIPKVVWRGNIAMNGDLRGALVDAGKDKVWADLANMAIDPDPRLRLEEFQYCRYAMTVYTEGQTYSGRLTFLLNCRSLLISPEVQWAMHYTHLLVAEGPDQNYVRVKRDWSDLEEKVLYYLAHPDEADRIITNMLATFRSRYTTRAATSCYIRELVRGYSKVSFEPATTTKLYDGEVEVARGAIYEAWLQTWADYVDFENRTYVGL